MFDDKDHAAGEDRELDAMLRTAVLNEQPDVSQVLARVRREMQPAPAIRRRSSSTFVLRAIAAALFLVVISGVLTIRARRNSELAVDAACDHWDELVQVSDKKWLSAPADVDAYVQQHFPRDREIVRSLAPSGASFAKLASCRLLTARFAHFVYRADGRDISVFVRISEPYEHPVRLVDHTESRLRLQVASFITPRYEGLVVAALSSTATREIADGVAGRL